MGLLLILFIAPTLPHGRKLCDLIARRQVPRLHRGVHLGLLLLRAPDRAPRIGIIVPAGILPSTRPRCLVHLIVLATLPDEVAETALTLALVLGVAAGWGEVRLRLLVAATKLWVVLRVLWVAAADSHVRSCLAGAAGARAGARHL